MREESIRCDVCRKKIRNCDGYLELVLPIHHTSEQAGDYLCGRQMDVCKECSNRFARLYYKIATANNSSWPFAIVAEEEEEE